MGISLVREHSQAIRPPRALWVPFPLGRPLGAPGDAAFQREVLLAALRLLERPAGPVLADFPHDAPGAVAAGPGGGEAGAGTALDDLSPILACPVPARGTAGGAPSLRDLLLAEVAFLHPWHDEARRLAGGRTTVGLSGLVPEEAASLLADFAADAAPVDPALLKLALDDLRAFCLEAGAAQPGAAAAGPAQLERWYWWDTQVGKALRAAHPRAAESDDPVLRMVGKVLMIPVAQREG